MCLDSRDICDLTAKELEYIPKIILLREFGRHIDYLWNKLPKHIRNDPEVQRYRRCQQHYNLPRQDTHIDGPAPLIKDCNLCRKNEVADC